jgi:hypothetical protein
MFLALLTFWVPLAVLVPLAALTLPVVTFLILTFGTMHKQWGDPYWGFILWIQKVSLLVPEERKRPVIGPPEPNHRVAGPRCASSRSLCSLAACASKAAPLTASR